MFENQYMVLLNVRKPVFCFCLFPEYVPPRQFLWGAKGYKKCNDIAEQTQGMCPIPIQANGGRRWHLALPCLVDADAAGDEGPRPSVRPQLSLAMDRFNFLFFSGDFLWGVAWWRLLSWFAIANHWYHPSEMWAGDAIKSERIESMIQPTLDFHLGTTYQKLQSRIIFKFSIQMVKFTGTTYLRPSWTIFHWALQKVLKSFLEFRF